MAGETVEKSIAFGRWATRHDPVMRRYLRAMLDQATGAAAEHLRPQSDGDGPAFRLVEGVLVGRR